jgi:hypothetical protein
LKTRKLLVFRDAKNAENGKNWAQLERNWNAGFSSFHPSREVFQSEIKKSGALGGFELPTLCFEGVGPQI